MIVNSPQKEFAGRSLVAVEHGKVCDKIPKAAPINQETAAPLLNVKQKLIKSSFGNIYKLKVETSLSMNSY